MYRRSFFKKILKNIFLFSGLFSFFDLKFRRNKKYKYFISKFTLTELGPAVAGTKGGGGGCFVQGTLVELENGESIAIDKIKVGDRVKTFDEELKKYTTSKISKTLHHDSSRQMLFEFTLSHNKKFTSNDIHPIYEINSNTYLQVSDLYKLWKKEGHPRLLGKDFSEISILDIKVSQKNVKVFNLHVESPYDLPGKPSLIGHNYFVEGILVHNDLNKN